MTSRRNVIRQGIYGGDSPSTGLEDRLKRARVIRVALGVAQGAVSAATASDSPGVKVRTHT
jgi:hypothetical protein